MSLNAVEAETPVGKIVHVVLDNYATHKHPKVKAWLARHPRFVFHFTPKSCSWLNAVETLFSRLTRRRLKLGVFRSIVDLHQPLPRRNRCRSQTLRVDRCPRSRNRRRPARDASVRVGALGHLRLLPPIWRALPMTPREQCEAAIQEAHRS